MAASRDSGKPFQPFQLSCNLVGHSKDVRCLDSLSVPNVGSSHVGSSAAPNEPCMILVSGSRDFTAKQWHFTPPKSFKEGVSFAGHGNFVSSICIVPVNKHSREPLVATGSTDTTIRLFRLAEKQPLAQLLGHSGNVSALRASPSGLLVSASWDSCVKQWLELTCVNTMQGHEAAVWDVEIAEETGNILSASADKTIKCWNSGKCVQTFIGHTDCVRGIAMIGAQEFVSCSNDATLRRWSLLTADCLQVFYGHSNFIYAVKFSRGYLFTASEDKSVKVWNLQNSNEPLQSIVMPAQSNWCLSVLPNGDLAVGCSDASIRIFTQSANRVASEEQLKLFSEEVATSSIPSQSTIGDLKISELPGPEALMQPGKREGQTVMVREGPELAFCYQWSSAKKEWEKVGQILGGSGGTQVTSGKQLYRGKEYDYVFSVKLDEDKDALKLPYNVDQDPWHVARQFILDNELDALFLDQVANFIINNTAGVTIGARSMGNVDPFTGNPDAQFEQQPAQQTSAPAKSAKQGQDTTPGFKPGSNVGNVDPYTGHSATSSASNEYFPLSDFLVLFKTNFEKDLEKIVEYNEKTQFKLSQGALAAVTAVNANQSSMDPAVYDVISCILTWEMDYVFPFFDLSIQFTNHAIFCKALQPKFNAIMSRIVELRNCSSKASQTMALRFLANLSGSELGQKMLRDSSELVRVIESFSNSTVTPVGLALATLILNVSVLAHNECMQMNYLYLVPVFVQMFSRDSLDEETTFRTLVAIGTVCYGCEVVRDACKSANLVAYVENAPTKLNSPKVNDCSAKLSKMLKKY